MGKDNYHVVGLDWLLTFPPKIQFSFWMTIGFSLCSAGCL